MAIRRSYKVAILLMLLALGAIIVPVFYSKTQIEYPRIHASSSIPPPPLVPNVPGKVTNEVKVLQQTVQQQIQSMDQSVKLSQNSDVNNQAWLIQLVTLSSQTNAEAMVENLQKAGVDAYSITKQEGNKTLYEIMVGPIIGKESAKTELSKLAKQYQLKAILVPYKIDT